MTGLGVLRFVAGLAKGNILKQILYYIESSSLADLEVSSTELIGPWRGRVRARSECNLDSIHDYWQSPARHWQVA